MGGSGRCFAGDGTGRKIVNSAGVAEALGSFVHGAQQQILAPGRNTRACAFRLDECAEKIAKRR
jgi:hypothetical protein